MAVNLSSLAGAGQQFFDNDGVPLAGGKLFSFEAGTTTPQTTFTSADGVTQHANPIILDSAGRVPGGQIWLSAGLNYKFVLETSDSVLIATWDNITGINGTGITSDASNVNYTPAGVGAVATTVQAKLREVVSVKDFGAVGDGVTDDATAIQLALNHIKTLGGGTLYFPSGTYYCNSTAATVYAAFTVVEILNIAHLALKGDGDSSIIRLSDNISRHFINIDYGDYVSISDLVFIGRDPLVFSTSGRALNFRFCSNVKVTNCVFKNWGIYAISHQQGAAKSFIFNNLTFENIAGDCIDIKNLEAPANPTEQLVVSNILAKSWGVTGQFTPNVVVDCRMPMSVTNVRGIITHPGSSVVRVSDNDCNISNIFGKDIDRTVPRIGVFRSAVIDLGNITRCTVNNIIADNTDIGVWLQGSPLSQLVITNCVISNCHRGIIVTGLSENVVIANSSFNFCNQGIQTGESNHFTITGCNANGCDQFLQLGQNSFLNVIGNNVQNSGTRAWNMPVALLNDNQYTFIGNTTDISPSTKNYMRSLNNIIAFSATATNAVHTSYLEARTGVASAVLAADGSQANINLTLTPKGTGNVSFGAHTVNADAPITGFITILDSGGTPRKLAVIT
jgi:hypothetical protein